MYTDRQGNTLTGATAESAQLYDKAVEAFNVYRGDPIALADDAIATAPAFVMAHILKAHLFAAATEPAAVVEALVVLEHAKTLAATEREASHLAALDRVLRGDWTAAAVVLDRHTMHYPHDLVALQVGHLTDFYRGNARDLRDRVARVLPLWSSDVPGHSFVLGLYAFGLEETGDYARAEDFGRQALEIQPLDCWAHHAVAHVLEMQGRAHEGIAWMTSREPYWSGADNFFKVHNWWHRALFHLDLGQIDDVLALYDGPIREDRSEIALDLVDASALLWRLQLTGTDVGERWSEVSDAWDQHADGRTYPFNDWHAVMAYLGAGRLGEVERILAAYRNHSTHGPETARWARQVSLPLVEGFRAFWQGKYEAAVERLHPARFIVNSFGGSHAQRDIIDWTLTEAALRGGLNDVAVSLAHERLALKPTSPVNQGFLNRAETARRDRSH